MPATTHVLTPARMHDLVTTYMSSPGPALMQPPHKTPSFPGNPMPSSVVRSNSLNSNLWAPGMGSAKALRTENTALLPIHLSNHMAAPSSSSQQPRAALEKLHSSLPGNHVTAAGSASQHPRGALKTMQPSLPGNHVTASHAAHLSTPEVPSTPSSPPFLATLHLAWASARTTPQHACTAIQQKQQCMSQQHARPSGQR